MSKPLAEKLRPQAIADIVGQQHLLKPGKLLHSVLSGKSLTSLILWGPPGCGKTTIARLIADVHKLPFTELSGVEFGVATLKEFQKTPQVQLIFVDEIHRLNKSQQDRFLPYVESGRWILIGATTENPSFEVISPLLSRSKLLVLERLEAKDLEKLLNRVEKYYKEQANLEFEASAEVKDFLISSTNGDARKLLGTIETLVEILGEKLTNLDEVKDLAISSNLIYDKSGEQHYDTISALHKSVRGSDADASLYYLARMLHAGEDPLYIARRLIRMAVEDIGNADRGALVITNAAFEATHKLGRPECDVVLAQAVVYLAEAKKSNRIYVGYKKALADVVTHGNLEIPKKLRNAPTKMMKQIGYGKGYKYAHDYSAEEMQDETYLPQKLVGKKYLD